MDDDVRERIRDAAERQALYNALEHGGDAQVGAIVGPLMAEHPEFRAYGDEVPEVVAPVVATVNDRSSDAQRARLGEVAPDLLADLDAEEPAAEEHALPDLPDVESYETVRMRVAPNPNGPWHLGHARMPAVIGTYADRYDGSFLVRFDDTDPETKRPSLDAYDAILDDITYLGFEPDDVITASDRLDLYYEHARDLIDAGGAYTCSCPPGEFSALKNDGEPCPHREKSTATTRSEFDAMVSGEYDAGEMVLRVRTDIEHPNPALRDWVAFRIVDTPHPREAAASYRCWPMLDFQSGVDDHLTDVTHIIRGIDLQDSAKRQRFLYDYFDWEYPAVVHWGHVQVEAYGVEMSTSTIAEKIAAGDLDGWDDPRAPTLASLRRRGIRGAAVTDAMIRLGTSSSNVDLSMSAIYATNRELVDDEATRRFFVRGGESVPVSGGPDAATPPRHPDHEDRGTRHVPVGDAVRVEPADLPAAGERVWLKGYGCVRYDGEGFTVTGDDIAAVREEGVDVIHWVPDAESVPLRLRTPDGDVSGHAEPGIRDHEPDDVVQFVRVGYARMDAVGEACVAYFAHE